MITWILFILVQTADEQPQRYPEPMRFHSFAECQEWIPKVSVNVPNRLVGAYCAKSEITDTGK